jgi:hypothetical protein
MSPLRPGDVEREVEEGGAEEDAGADAAIEALGREGFARCRRSARIDERTQPRASRSKREPLEATLRQVLREELPRERRRSGGR